MGGSRSHGGGAGGGGWGHGTEFVGRGSGLERRDSCPSTAGRKF